MKNKLCGAFCFIMIGTLAVSCGSAPSENTETSRAVDTLIETTSESDKEDTEYQPSGENYNGDTFTILDYHTDVYSWQAQAYSDITSFEENGEPINDAIYHRNCSVEEELNIKLESLNSTATNRSTANDLKKYILAGDDTIDAAFVFTGEVKNLLGETEFLASLDNIDTLNTSASWWNQNAVENFTFNGSLKVITGDISYCTTISPFLVYFNKNIVDTYKLGDLYEMVYDNKWTFDEYIRLSNNIANDINGDNNMDENDRFGSTMQYALLPYMMRSCGVRLSQKNAGGGVDIILNSERTVNVFEKLMTFIHDTNVVNLDSVFSSKYKNVYFECQMPMFKNNQILFYYSQLLVSFELRSMDSDFGILPTPKYDEKQEKYITAVSNTWSSMLCIPQTNNQLERTGYILDALGYYSQQFTIPAIIDTTVKNKSIRDDDSAEMLEIVLDNIEYDIAEIYNWGNIYSFLTNMSSKNDMNFASNYSSIETAVKAEISKTLN